VHLPHLSAMDPSSKAYFKIPSLLQAVQRQRVTIWKMPKMKYTRFQNQKGEMLFRLTKANLTRLHFRVSSLKTPHWGSFNTKRRELQCSAWARQKHKLRRNWAAHCATSILVCNGATRASKSYFSFLAPPNLECESSKLSSFKELDSIRVEKEKTRAKNCL